MTDLHPKPSREEQEFWESEFRDPPRPRHDHSLPRREQRLARSLDSPFTRLTDRLRDWRADARFGVVVLVLVALVAGVLWYRIGVGGATESNSGAPDAVTSTAPRTTVVTAAAAGTGNGAPDPDGRIAVHVAGAVAHPGVVELRAGARVIDAVEAVGGALTDGDLDRLNLAARISDGQRIYVAKVGQSDPGAVGDPAAADDPTGGTTGGKVNLNTATQAQLEELPGIGPTYAQAIISERQRRGRFTSVNDLRSVRGIGEKRFAELAPLVTV